MADRPVLFACVERTADDALRSVQRDQATDHARRRDLPPVGHEVYSGAGLTRFRSLPVGRRGRGFAETFESVAKKSAVGVKRMHV